MTTTVDEFDRGLVLAATGLLRDFNEAGVLLASDVHVALRLADLLGEAGEPVMLAAALAVRAVRSGSVCVKQERETALVFTRTKHRADQLGRVLRCAGHRVAVLHGDRSLSQRRSALDGFKRGVFRVLVGTDIAARGIDVANIGHVINFDLPHCPADEGHRTGHEFCDGGRPTAASCHRTSAWACRPAGVRQSTTIVR